ncbi:ABC transporter ATP-binding protein [Desulfomarina sp.]
MNNSKQNILLRAENVAMTYPKTPVPALDHISLFIRKGELLGLIGPNGAGKTTLISILSTLFPPTEGTLLFDSIDMVCHPDRIRQRIGLVPQETALYNNLTGRENLLYFASLYGLRKNNAREQVNHYLEMFGLDKKADNRVKTYSGGMKRRINLIAGLLHQPELLFLDEPTVGIDAQSRNLILEKLLLLHEQGMTMVYTTHYMEEIEKICENVAIIDQGKTICHGNPAQLINGSPGISDLSELFFARTGKALRDS